MPASLKPLLQDAHAAPSCCTHAAVPSAGLPLLQVQTFGWQALLSSLGWKPARQDAHLAALGDVHAVPSAGLPLLQVHTFCWQDGVSFQAASAQVIWVSSQV